MAMNVSGASGGYKSDINITPMVDVILVLLIIFMVSVPLLQMGYPVQVPPKVQTVAPQPMEDQIIVRMDAQGQTYINSSQIPIGDFGARLRQALTGRQSKVVFFAADGDLSFDKVADFMDLCRDNGAENLGIVFEDLRGGGGAAAAPAAGAP